MTVKFYLPALLIATMLGACGGGDTPAASNDRPVKTIVTVPVVDNDDSDAEAPMMLNADDFVTSRRAFPISRNENIAVVDDAVILTLQSPTPTLALKNTTPLSGTEDYVFRVNFDGSDLNESVKLRTTVWVLDAQGEVVDLKAFEPYAKTFATEDGRQTATFVFGAPNGDGSARRTVPSRAEGQSLLFLLSPLNKIEGQSIKIYDLDVSRN